MEFEPVDDLEQAYLRALEATDALEEDLARTFPPDESATQEGTTRIEGNASGTVAGPGMDLSSPEAVASDGRETPAVERDEGATPLGGDRPATTEPLVDTAAGSHDRPVDEAATAAEPHAEVPPRVTPRQILEAALFVGGTPLTAKRLCAMLRGEYDLDFIEQTIDDLNLQYTEEARPYEIRLGEGGYRLVLRPEFERVRNRVYGIVPKEVKLSQEVLEVLALVAYRQPVSKEDIESFGKANPGGALRQLLRRELISIERGSGGRKDIRYHTTSRFLSLFGLSDLDELPQADELSFK